MAWLWGFEEWLKMVPGEASMVKGWTSLQPAATPLRYAENHGLCPTAQACGRFHVGFYVWNPSTLEMSVCFCRALGVSEHAVVLPSVNSADKRETKLGSHGVGGFQNQIVAVSP